MFARLTVVTAAATGVLLVVGAQPRQGREFAGLSFRDCRSRMADWSRRRRGGDLDVRSTRARGARASRIWLAIRARQWYWSKDLVILSTVALALYGAQILVGAANVWTELSAAAVTAHVTLSAMIWGILVAIATVSRRFAAHTRGRRYGRSLERQARTLRETTAAYFQLTKPRIVVLLLITTVPAMMLAEGGMPSIGLVLATLVGGSDRRGLGERDQLLPRPRHRRGDAADPSALAPVAQGHARPRARVRLRPGDGLVLLPLDHRERARGEPPLSAIAFYVFVYTMWLKRSSVQNIVIGARPGPCRPWWGGLR